MKIKLDREIVKEILIQESFYHTVPEYFFMKEVGSQIVSAISQEGGCSACTERNIVEPAIMTFISHTVNMYLDCGRGSCLNLKSFIKILKDIKEDFSIVVLYKENEDMEIAELII